MNASDTVVRAITDDGAFRVITARTTETVRGAIAAQHATGKTARYFADLLTGSILFRETMAPRLRVQGILKSAGAQLVADSHPSGKTRGLIQLPEGKGELELNEDAQLRVMRTLPNGRLNQGVVEVDSAGGISTALMAYMQTSEQVVSMLAVGNVVEHNDIVSAGGYLVQLLPEVDRGPLMLMTERLRDFESIEQQLKHDAFSPRGLMQDLLYGIPFTELDESHVGFECWCDQLRLVAALSTLPRSDVEHLVADGEVLEISCDYCGKEYRVPPAQLQGLLDES